MSRVLLIETGRTNPASFARYLKNRYELYLAYTGQSALKVAAEYPPDVVIVDAASLRTSGNRLCTMLREAMPMTYIIHVKQKPKDKRRARTADNAADEMLYLPFTYRKLCNRIERYLNANRGEILATGPFRLNVQQGLLITPEGEQKLTPKLSRLMALFMNQAGEIVERKSIIKEVWHTDYMGDTRTLDVHIRWMRQMIEANPSNPQYLKTVRGKGYRLELPE